MRPTRYLHATRAMTAEWPTNSLFWDFPGVLKAVERLVVITLIGVLSLRRYGIDTELGVRD
jgi:hypothetical protein